MDGPCGTHACDGRDLTASSENLTARLHLHDEGLYGRIILKCNLKKSKGSVLSECG